MYILFEGIDNVGKTTQIKLLNTALFNKGYINHVLHYSSISNVAPDDSRMYSERMYKSMFNFLNKQWIENSTNSFILDRSHIGEMVYSPIYRDYSGDYVLDIEREYYNSMFWRNVYLFVFIDEPENAISRDDGESFTIDIEKKQDEINSFIEAYHKSLIINKTIINICDKNIEEVHNEIYNFIWSKDA